MVFRAHGSRKANVGRIFLMILVMVIFPIAYFASNINKTAAQPDAEGFCCSLGGIRDAWTEPKTKLTEAVLEQRDFTFAAEELQAFITQRENYLNILMQQQSQEPEDAGSGSSETGDFTSECVIATVAFGSNLAPQVQFLREFRDGRIMTTVTGSSFMDVFNSWYYSFSPQVATYERDQPWLQQTVRIGIQPLLSILQLSENGYSLFRGEPGSMTAGFIASSLIGAVYFTPFALFSLRKQSRMQRGSVLAVSVAGASIAMITAGLLLGNSAVLIPATAVFVLATIAASAMSFARLILFLAARPAVRLIAMRLAGIRRRHRADPFSGIVMLVISILSISVASGYAQDPQVPVEDLSREEIVAQLERLAEIKAWLEDTRRIESFFPQAEDSIVITTSWIDFFNSYMAQEGGGVSYEVFRQNAVELGNNYQQLSSKVYNDGVADRHFVIKDTLSSGILQLSYSISDMLKITFGRDPPDPYYSSILALQTASENFNTYALEVKEEKFEIRAKIFEIESMSG